jgi:hypothetical protein
MVVYERVIGSTNDQAKRRVDAVAGIKWDEVISKAIIGRFNSHQGLAGEQGQADGERKYLKKSKIEDAEMVDEEEKKPYGETVMTLSSEETTKDALTKAV